MNESVERGERRPEAEDDVESERENVSREPKDDRGWDWLVEWMWSKGAPLHLAEVFWVLFFVRSVGVGGGRVDEKEPRRCGGGPEGRRSHWNSHQPHPRL